MRVGLIVLVGCLYGSSLVADPGRFRVAAGVDGLVRHLALDVSGSDFTGPDLDGPVVDDASSPIPRGELDYLIEQYEADRALRGGVQNIGDQSLQVIQVNYVDSRCPFDCDGATEGVQSCNIILLLWREDTANPEGVDILIDDVLVTSVDGLPPPEDQPDARTNSVFIVGVAAGLHTITVEEANEGTTDSLDFEVLDAQPFGDATNVRCWSAPSAVDAAGNPVCVVRIGWANGGPLPNRNLVLFNGNQVLGTVANDPNQFFLQTLVTVTGASAGEWRFTAIGFSDAVPGDPRRSYRGCFAQSPACELTCEEPVCRAPLQPWAAQLTYDEESEAPNEVFLLWICGQLGLDFTCTPHAGGIRLWDTDQVVGILDGGSEEVFLAGGATGDHIFGLEGLCQADPEVASEISEKPMVLLDESPLPEPVSDFVRTFGTFQVEDADGIIQDVVGYEFRFTAVERAEFIMVYAGNTIIDVFPGTVPGAERVIVIPAVEADDLRLQFFAYFDEVAYGSGFYPDASSVLFVRGNCDGDDNPNPQITDAIVLLSRLFLGGAQPPCAAACDADSSGVLNITDAVYILGFLFLGGPAPVEWGGRTPTCEAFGAGAPSDALGCETSYAQCAGAGPI